MLKRVMTVSMLFTVACQGDDAADCASGFEARDDGLCYELAAPPDEDTDDEEQGTSDPATIAQVLEGLEPCTAESGTGTLDIQDGCVQGVCAGWTFQEIDDALGNTSSCSSVYYETATYEFIYADCAWPGGISAFFAAGEDGEPDPAMVITSLDVDLPNQDTTEEGLGLGAEMRCFVDAFGVPDYVIFRRTLLGWQVATMGYPAFWVRDSFNNEDGSWGSDGLADSLTLSGY